MVAGSRSASRAVTGRPYSMETPRSPRESPADEGDELRGDRLVQTVARAERGNFLGREGTVSLRPRERITRRRPHEEEKERLTPRRR